METLTIALFIACLMAIMVHRGVKCIIIQERIKEGLTHGVVPDESTQRHVLKQVTWLVATTILLLITILFINQ